MERKIVLDRRFFVHMKGIFFDWSQPLTDFLPQLRLIRNAASGKIYLHIVSKAKKTLPWKKRHRASDNTASAMMPAPLHTHNM